MSGHIIKRGKAWRVRIELERDPETGQRRFRYVTVNGTKRDAEKVLRDALYQRDHGIDVEPTKVTTGQLLERWIADYAAHNVAPSTLRRYRQLARQSSAIIGATPLQKLRPAHIAHLHARLAEPSVVTRTGRDGRTRTHKRKGLSAQTVVHHHRVVREALQWAVRMQLIAANPADAAPAPRVVRREMQALDAAGVAALLDAIADAELRRIVYVAVQTGLRVGELLALRWPDLDLEAGNAAIRRSVGYVDGKLVWREPKTARGRRSIALSPGTVDALRKQRAVQAERKLRAGRAYQDTDLVWADELGAPRSPNAISQRFIRIARGAGFEGFRFHDLRHTAATLALRAGVHPKVVQERLGHASIQITLDTYSHVLPDLQREAADALDAIIGDAPADDVHAV